MTSGKTSGGLCPFGDWSYNRPSAPTGVGDFRGRLNVADVKEEISSDAPALEAVDATYRADSRSVLPTLIRLLGDFDLAEVAVRLLELMLLHDSRHAARSATNGDLILLEDQDRSLWQRDQIAEGLALVQRALAGREIENK